MSNPHLAQIHALRQTADFGRHGSSKKRSWCS